MSLYARPAHYRRLFDQRTHDLPFWLSVARPRILEYGAGTGRVTIPLARAGHHVTAVDLSQEMLDELERSLDDDTRSRVTLVQGDMRTLSLNQRFDIALCAFNGIGHCLTNDELLGFLAKGRYR